MKRYVYIGLCLCLLAAFCAPTFAQQSQQQVVKGLVVDSKNEPLIGASVTIKGGTIGTITDIDGHFSLTVPTNSQLVISYIGYTRQFVTPTSGQNLKITLKEDTETLDEVVVVGYGTQKMKNVTGSIATLNPTEISDLSVSNLGTALSGMINGLSVSGGDGRPGETASLTVRQADVASEFGASTYHGPLFVIDDYICPEEQGQAMFNNLDPSEVESITVLKDASAAVYGSRAANGVVLVKT
ncbi:MAG: carboxypeptidase-like regulatory domain-containing protein, partial [Mediterranea sp.]|nr:carboxypeptidase-like regulatory domain-containing protein [Mediterranea sp.]